jgi:hypothetical protein
MRFNRLAAAKRVPARDFEHAHVLLLRDHGERIGA